MPSYHSLAGFDREEVCKIDLYSAAWDLFDEVDGFTRLLGEVSCIARRGERLLGWAKDRIAAGRALGSIFGPRPNERRVREVLYFGAGGAGHAITLHILTATPIEDRPRRMIVVEPDLERLERLQALHDRSSEQTSYDPTSRSVGILAGDALRIATSLDGSTGVEGADEPEEYSHVSLLEAAREEG